MSIITLLIVALAGSFSITWLVHYIPLKSSIFGKEWSPRLAFCHMLGPFDAILTLILVMGGWVGFTTAITGISMMIYNVMTGIGISLGVLFTKKVLAPRWRKQYNQQINDQQNVRI